MFRIVAIHSFRGGTGKSNIAANLATILAETGKRVGIVDIDLQSPGIHVLFGLDPISTPHNLNHYLWGSCELEEAVCEVTPSWIRESGGSIFLIPGSLSSDEITRITEDGYDMARLSEGLRELIERFQLDCLFLDTHPGFNNETLLTMALADLLMVVLRPDSQDFQGTAVTVDISRELGIPKLMLVLNKLLPALDRESLCQHLQSVYQAPVAGVLSACDEMMLLGSRDVFYLRYPDHYLSAEMKAIATTLGF